MEWKDSDNEAGIRPSYINVGLIVKNGEKVVDEIWREITDYSNVKSIILYGKDYANYKYALDTEPIDGYRYKFDTPTDGCCDFLVTYTLNIIPKPLSMLPMESVFVGAYSSLKSDCMNCFSDVFCMSLPKKLPLTIILP